MNKIRLNPQFYFMGVPPRSLVLEQLGISKEQDDELQANYVNAFVNHRGEVLSNNPTKSAAYQRKKNQSNTLNQMSYEINRRTKPPS